MYLLREICFELLSTCLLTPYTAPNNIPNAAIDRDISAISELSVIFWVGCTIDDACGEAFDKGGKMLGLGYPAGHIIDKLANFGDRERFDFPIGLKASADTRLSFSGLKTALRVFIEKNPIIANTKNQRKRTNIQHKIFPVNFHSQ